MLLDSILIILAGICVITGLLGCILPVLPGPVISYAGLILLHLSGVHSFTMEFLITFALLTMFVGILDYIVPIYGTQKLGGSKYGIWGCTLGLLTGLFILFPAGIVIGPMLGAFAGEMISGKKASHALKPAIGSFLGFLASTLVRLLLAAVMAYYFIMAVYGIYFSA